MGTITNCLGISALPQEERNHIRDLAKRLREDDGLDHQRAAIQALESTISEYTTEHQGIIKQVEEAGGVAPEEWVIEVPRGTPEIVSEEVKDRRKDITQRKRIEEMTQEEMRRELLTDELTGIGNRRAYNESEKLPYVASIDLDALKWVNDNMGHPSGDMLLKKLGEALGAATDNAYHISGDEFVVQANTEAEVQSIMDKTETALNSAIVQAKLPDGSILEKTGVDFSYGIGETINVAEERLKQHKAEREAAGIRAERGAEPRGVVKKPTERKPVGEREVKPSKAVPTEKPKSTVEQLTNTLLKGRFAKPVQKMLDTGKLEIVQSEKNLPSDIRELETAGAYIGQNDVVYIVADNVSDSNVEGLILHEGFHGRGREILGKAQYDRMITRLERLEKTETDWFKKARKAVPEDTPKEYLYEEIAAYAIQQHQTDPQRPKTIKAFVEALLASIRRGLVRLGWLPKNFTPADLHIIAQSALRRFAKSKITEEVKKPVELYSKKEAGKISGLIKEDGMSPIKEPRSKRMLNDLADGFVYHFINRFKDLLDIQKELGDIPETQNAALAEELFSGRARKRLDDLDDFHVRPLLKAIDEAEMTLEEVGQYLHARHAQEANKVLKERNPDRKNNDALSGMSDQEAKNILAEFSKNPNIKAIARKVDAINEERLNKLVDDGLVAKEQVDSWKSMYKSYIPLHRDQTNSEEGILGDLPPKGTGYHIAGKEVKLRAGSTKEVDHRLIIPHIVANYEASAIRGEKNLVGQSLLEMVRDNPDPDIWTIDELETYVKLDKDGVIVERPDTRLHDNELGVKVDGELHRINFNKNNPKAMRLVKEMKNLQQREMPKFFRHIHTVMRFLSAVNTSFNPEFVISNFARDLQTAGYNLGDTDIDGLQKKVLKDAIKHGIKGMWQNLRHKHDSEWAKYADEFERAGGMVGWLDNYDSIEDRAKAIEREMNIIGKGAVPKKAIRAIVDFVADANGSIENAVRLSSFVHARRAGLSAKKAASLAKNLTVNFNRKGASSQYFNLAYLFFNASVQGSARMLSAISKSKKVRGMVGATVVAAMLLDILNRDISGDDDDDRKYYDKIPDTVKDRNLIIMTGDGPADYIKIPLPWGYNIFHVIGQIMSRATYHDEIQGYTKAKEAARLMSAITEAFNPMSAGSFLQSVSPTLLDPAVKVAENKDWHGGALMPSENPFGPPTPKSERYFRSVSEQSKFIARELNELTGGNKVRPGWWDWSPEWFDMIVGDALGGSGTFVMKLTDTSKRFYSGEEVERKNIPFARKIIGYEYPSSDYELFFERANDLEILKKELKEYRGEERRKIRERHPDKIRIIPIYESYQKRLKELRKRRNRLEIKKAPKREIDAVNDKILATIKKFNKRYNSATNQ